MVVFRLVIRNDFRRKLIKGYWYIRNPDHPFCDLKKYVAEHRLVMEEYLDRYLTRKEVVHHLDMNKENNRIGNLMLFSNNREHLIYELFMYDRRCLLCKSDKTYIKKNGSPLWYSYKNEFICRKCYDHERNKK